MARVRDSFRGAAGVFERGVRARLNNSRGRVRGRPATSTLANYSSLKQHLFCRSARALVDPDGLGVAAGAVAAPARAGPEVAAGGGGAALEHGRVAEEAGRGLFGLGARVFA